MIYDGFIYVLSCSWRFHARLVMLCLLNCIWVAETITVGPSAGRVNHVAVLIGTFVSVCAGLEVLMSGCDELFLHAGGLFLCWGERILQ